MSQFEKLWNSVLKFVISQLPSLASVLGNLGLEIIKNQSLIRNYDIERYIYSMTKVASFRISSLICNNFTVNGGFHTAPSPRLPLYTFYIPSFQTGCNRINMISLYRLKTSNVETKRIKKTLMGVLMKRRFL